jgi:hypothetical protein
VRRGKPALAEAAAKAVSKWLYEPSVFNTVEVETVATISAHQEASVVANGRQQPRGWV